MLRSAVSPAVAARARGAVRIPRASPALRAPAAAPTRGMAGRRKAKARDGVVAATSDSGERTAALEAALRHIESSHGKGAVMRLGERPVGTARVIPTGSLTVDHALGVGGLPRGRVVEIFGPESSGKTTLALRAIAEAQKLNGQCCFIDAEHALDPSWASTLGVDTDSMLISQPDSGEQALEIADTLVRSGGLDVVVVDSVAALVPRAEAEGEMGDHHMALQARLMSQALRKLTSSLSRADTLIIFINQIRSKVGVMFGSPEVTAGGNALKYYASVRIDIRRRAPIKRGDEVIGYETQVKVVKNKVAPPFRMADFDLLFGEGISRSAELVHVGVTLGLLKRSGAWYSFTEEAEQASGGVLAAGNVGQGKDKTKAYLEENPEVADALEKAVRAAMVQAREDAARGRAGARAGAQEERGGEEESDESVGALDEGVEGEHSAM